MSIHEESTIAGEGPAMGVFNNLVMYDQHVAQSGLNSIEPDLATEWSWNEERTQLTFRLRQGVKWHDGKPFTAKDVKCTFDLLQGTAAEKLRLNPRKPWYRNLEEVVVERRRRGDVRAETAAAGVYHVAGIRVSPDLPCRVPPARCASTQSEPARSTHRIQTQRTYWRPPQPRLLERRPALS